MHSDRVKDEPKFLMRSKISISKTFSPIFYLNVKNVLKYLLPYEDFLQNAMFNFAKIAFFPAILKKIILHIFAMNRISFGIIEIYHT